MSWVFLWLSGHWTRLLSSCLEQSRSLYSTALEFIVLSSVFNLRQQLSELDRPPSLVSYIDHFCGSDATDLDLYQFFWNVTEAKSWILMTVAWFWWHLHGFQGFVNSKSLILMTVAWFSRLHRSLKLDFDDSCMVSKTLQRPKAGF